MIQKLRLELTPEQIRERSDRAGLRPYIADIIDFNTHIHTKYLVFAEHPTVAIDMARKHGFHARGSAGTATPADTAFIAHIIGQVGRLICENVDARCIVSTRICSHCGEPVDIRNPSGFCDHLYYPDYCPTCSMEDSCKTEKTVT